MRKCRIAISLLLVASIILGLASTASAAASRVVNTGVRDTTVDLVNEDVFDAMFVTSQTQT